MKAYINGVTIEGTPEEIAIVLKAMQVKTYPIYPYYPSYPTYPWQPIVTYTTTSDKS